MQESDVQGGQPFFKKPKIVLITAAVLALVLLITVVFVTLGWIKQPNQGATTKIYDRPGYDRNDLPPGISDPFALAFKSKAQPERYKGAPVIQACNLLSVTDLANEGIRIDSDLYQSSISRTIYDGKGGMGFADLPKRTSTTLAVSGQNHMTGCMFTPKDGTILDDITITAFQPTVLPEADVSNKLQILYNRQSSLEGFDVYTKKPTSIENNDDEIIAYKSGAGGFALKISKSILKSHQGDLMQKLLPVVARHFKKEQTKTSGVSTISFDSPLFTKSTFNACDALVDKDIRSFSGGKPATPTAIQTVAPYIANATTKRVPSMDFYTVNDCVRKTFAPYATGELQLRLTIHTFLEEDTARYWAENTAAQDPNWKQLPEIHGGLLVGENKADLYFSKGRAKFVLAASAIVNRDTPVHTSEEAMRTLLPIAKAIMARQAYR
jgi:hypothetical protein